MKHVLLVVVADALVYIFGLQKRMEKIGERSPAINNILSLLSSLKLNEFFLNFFILKSFPCD